MIDLIGEARRLAELNLRVFPVRTGEKRPALNGWQQQATTNPAEVERLLRAWPGCNLGVATGERSGVFVLDVDTKGADGWNSLLALELL